MSTDQDKLRVGIITTLSITAWSLSLATTAYCSFVTRIVHISIIKDNTTTPILDFDDPLVRLGFTEHGVGFYRWRLYDKCFKYCIDGFCPDFDRNFNTASAMSTMVNVLAGIGILTQLWQFWRSIRVKWIDFGVYYFAMCLFQGLTLLILRSDICYHTGYFDYIEEVRNITGEITVKSVDCVVEKGSIMSIVATAFWFVAAVLCLVQGDPKESDDD